MIRNVIAIALIAVTCAACSTTSSKPIPNAINVVSVDANGNAVFTPYRPQHVWSTDNSTMCTICPNP